MSTPITELSPLDQIWQTEAEITGRVAAAREEAKQIVREAQSQALRIKIQARETGRCRGQTEFRKIVTQAEEEARKILSEAQSQAEDLQIKGQHHMCEAEKMAVRIILGLEMDGGEA
jgi:vacuolar-type H+-ATPase subunit H